MRLLRNFKLRDTAVVTGAATAEVKPGTRFSRLRADRVTEMATVVDLRDDPFGIPHVRFKLAFEQTMKVRGDESERVLALQSFLNLYRTRVA